MARIALDAMGGDNAPKETVAGAVEARRLGVDVVLVGDPTTLEPEAASHGISLEIIPATDVIDMADDPARALRDKPNASIPVCARLVASGDAAGFVSAGSTGAAMAAAAILIGRIPGVSRPAIATIFPTAGSPTLVLDSGANPEVKAAQLLQFGVMGSIAAGALLGVEDPRVGLLSIGEEKGKGRDLEREAYELLSSSDLNFLGNVEGRDVATDKVDVIVTDGFTGNVFLKTTEGTAMLVANMVREALSELPEDAREGVMPALAAVMGRMDWENHGGAQLLGVKGTTIISHGSSTRRSIANALKMAAESADKDIPGQVAAALS